MNVLGILENGLFALGQVLRFPVMALLWACVAAILVLAGGTLMEFLVRRRERHGFDIEGWLGQGALLGLDAPRRARLPKPLQRLLGEIDQGRAGNDASVAARMAPGVEATAGAKESVDEAELKSYVLQNVSEQKKSAPTETQQSPAEPGRDLRALWVGLAVLGLLAGWRWRRRPA